MSENTKAPKKTGNTFVDVVLKILFFIAKAIVFLARKFVEYFFNIVITILLVGIVTGGIVACTFAIYIRDNIDATFDLNSYVANLNQTSVVYYTDYDTIDRISGETKELGEIHTSQNRTWASIDAADGEDEALIIPEHLVNAFVAVEDKRFFQHSGVDWFRTGSAVINLATTFKKSYGGSTITQQLIKNLTGDDETTIQRKIQEILRALYLERTLESEYADYEDPKYQTKKKVMESYLNTIFLSQKAYGVQAAAQTYFSKDVSELTLVEAAAIAAIPQNPYKWNPYSHPDKNKERRDDVLSKMYAQGMITEEEYREAINTELVLNVNTEEESLNSYFVDYMLECVKGDLQEKYGMTEAAAEQMVSGGGLQIYSTIDPKIQKIVEEEYKNDANFPNTGDGIKPQSAFVVIDPYTGYLLAMVGGRGEKNGSTFNRASMAKRQPGSTIKPLAVYAPAIENKLVTWGTVLDDTPVTITPATKKTWPRNSSRTYRGLTTVKYGLQNSLNTISVKTLQLVTPEKSFAFLTEDLGITTLVDSKKTASGKILSDIGLAPLALGGLTYGAKLVEWANAYCIFPNNGVYSKSSTYTKVLNKDGEVILTNEIPVQSQVISEETATIMNYLLMNVVNNGTGRAASLKNKIQVAGKTGTTDENKDLWFMGYSPYLLGGAWYGYDTPKRLTGYGTNAALVVWNKVMTKIHDELILPQIKNGDVIQKKFKTYQQTGNIVKCEYCIDSGMLPCDACYNDIRGSSRIETGYFIKGTEPKKKCDVHVSVKYDKSTGSVACPGCPNTTTVSLIKVDREFPFYIAIGDAQYTYRDTGESFKSAERTDQPFYYGLRTLKTSEGASGYYYGIKSDIKAPANRICVTHIHNEAPVPEGQEETEKKE